jgi:hypothetical protein
MEHTRALSIELGLTRLIDVPIRTTDLGKIMAGAAFLSAMSGGIRLKRFTRT